MAVLEKTERRDQIGDYFSRNSLTVKDSVYIQNIFEGIDNGICRETRCKFSDERKSMNYYQGD